MTSKNDQNWMQNRSEVDRSRSFGARRGAQVDLSWSLEVSRTAKVDRSGSIEARQVELARRAGTPVAQIRKLGRRRWAIIVLKYRRPLHKGRVHKGRARHKLRIESRIFLNESALVWEHCSTSQYYFKKPTCGGLQNAKNVLWDQYAKNTIF